MNLHSNLLKDFNDDEVCTKCAAEEPFSEVRAMKKWAATLRCWFHIKFTNILRRKEADTYRFTRVSFVTIATALIL